MPVLAAGAAYAFGFGLIYRFAGPQTGALAFVPALLAGVLGGRRAGLVTGVLLVPTQFVVYGLVEGWSFTSFLRDGLMSALLLVVVGYGSGAIGDLLLQNRHQNRQLLERTAALHEAQRHYERLIGNLQEVVYTLANDGGRGLVPRFVSPQVVKFTGYAPSDFLADPALWYELVHPDDVDEVKRHIEALRTGTRFNRATYRLRHRDGSSRWIEDVAVSEFTPRGDFVGVFGVSRDVTARIQAERAQRENLTKQAEVDRLQEMNTFKTRFLNTAAHELNTPLTPLVLQLDLLRSERFGALSSTQLRAVEVVERNIERLALLVRDMLEAARLESGRLRLDVADMDLVPLVEEMVQAFAPAAEKANVTLAVEAPDQALAKGDARRLSQVLSNLISNALKFTPPSGRVHVRIDKTAEGAVVAVRDTGDGLSEAQMSRLFQPFSQVHDPMQNTHGGTGLGLYISKGIIEQHGGRIWCQSDGAGAGSCFAFLIPYNSKPSAPDASPDAPPDTVTSIEASQGTRPRSTWLPTRSTP